MGMTQLWFLASLGPPLLLIAYGVFKAGESWLSPMLWFGFAAGAGAGVLAAGVEHGLALLLHLPAHPAGLQPSRAMLMGFGVAALPEELLKMLAVIAGVMLFEGRRLHGVLMMSIAVAASVEATSGRAPLGTVFTSTAAYSGVCP